MSDTLTEKVAFDFIRYANCWEDPAILLEGLQLKENKKILSIGSAGDNSFSLLTTNPELVVAVDLNQTQLFLIELKKVCIQMLEREEAISFLGFTPSITRHKTFDLIKIELSKDARNYWENNSAIIEQGIILNGKFEKYFIYFSKKILPWIHSRSITENLLSTKSAAEQEFFYNNKWNNWRWRLLFKIFFSKYVLGKYGRDPQFLKEVQVSVGQYIFNKAAQHLKSESAQHNFILRFNLTGNFGTLLPHYLEAQNYSVIKHRLRQLKIEAGFAQDVLKKYGKVDAMNLSNIFEYMDPGVFQSTSSELLQGMNPGGRLAYWNLMVPRRISQILPNKASYQSDLSQRLSSKDRGFFYNQFIIDEAL